RYSYLSGCSGECSERGSCGPLHRVEPRKSAPTSHLLGSLSCWPGAHSLDQRRIPRLQTAPNSSRSSKARFSCQRAGTDPTADSFHDPDGRMGLFGHCSRFVDREEERPPVLWTQLSPRKGGRVMDRQLAEWTRADVSGLAGVLFEQLCDALLLVN